MSPWQCQHDLTFRELGRHDRMTRAATAPSDKIRLTIAPAFPLDARVRAVTVQGRRVKFEISQTGDVQRARVGIDVGQESMEIVFSYYEGTDVYQEQEIPVPGTINQGLRVLRSRADDTGLHLVLEGLGGWSYPLHVRGPHQLREIAGVGVTIRSDNTELIVQFNGPLTPMFAEYLTYRFESE